MKIQIDVDFWPQRTSVGTTVHRRGAVVEVGADDFERLVNCGAAHEWTGEKSVRERVVPEPEPEVVESPAATPEAGTPSEVVSDSQKPAKSAPTQVWKEFAESKGLNVKGLKTRAEYRAAVEAAGF